METSQPDPLVIVQVLVEATSVVGRGSGGNGACDLGQGESVQLIRDGDGRLKTDFSKIELSPRLTHHVVVLVAEVVHYAVVHLTEEEG